MGITAHSANGHSSAETMIPPSRHTSAKETQIGGAHYKAMKIQPAEFILANKLGWAEGCAIGYLSRWREKGGIEDLRKAIHSIELLIEAESLSQRGNGR